MGDELLLYGANGYTGELIARAAVAGGLRPRLAGRSPAVAALAAELGLPHLICALDDADGLGRALAGARAVLHCAGPFSETSRPMAEACLRAGAHYLDITGEIAVFEALAARDAEARAAGVMLLPGVGFDVVPSDCLAAHLARRLPGASELALAFRALGGLSRGTATTMLTMGAAGAERRAGRVVATPPLSARRDFDFGRGPTPCVGIPWGDVSTAYYSTGIPNIAVYLALPSGARRWVGVGRALAPLLAIGPLRGLLRALVRRSVSGPDAAARAGGRSLLVGEVRAADGRRAASRLECPEGYALTVATALLIARRVLAGDAPAGFQTPARAYGADLIMAVPGVRRVDLP